VEKALLGVELDVNPHLDAAVELAKNSFQS
jgi:hypothetical protein